MADPAASEQPLSWHALEAMLPEPMDRVQGPTNAQATLRLFGQPESAVRVTLYRDHHAWCPYCQKVWLWLEFRRIPYRIRKVTMRCYGPKEAWFTAKVPSGMLPVLELDGRLITESDEILIALERAFGPLGESMQAAKVRELRQLERLLFRAWCLWLCSPGLSARQDQLAREQFQGVARRMEQALMVGGGSWLDPLAPAGPEPGSADLVFVPYVERMNASLAYYKGFNLRSEHPGIDRWLAALEGLATAAPKVISIPMPTTCRPRWGAVGPMVLMSKCVMPRSSIPVPGWAIGSADLQGGDPMGRWTRFKL